MKNLTYLTAAWCAPCKQYLPLVKKEAAARGITVTEVVYDSPDGARLAQQYNVQQVPTIITDTGEVHSGPRTKRQLVELLDS